MGKLNLLSLQQDFGFTLIEILIVLFIISIVSSVALLSIGHNENKRLASFANELTQTMVLAEEQAMLQPSVLGVILKDNSLQFVTLQSITDKNKSWLPLNDKVLNQHLVPDNIQLEIEVGGQRVDLSDDKAATMPQIIISTNGDVTPFRIYIGKKGERPRYMVVGEADGNVINKSLS